MVALHPAFAEFLSCLVEHRVKFVIVGAFALAVLGRPRATKDIDVLVPNQAIDGWRFRLCGQRGDRA
jgi:hypothetical protein